MATASPHKKRLDIQGLRAIAVLAVLIFHIDHAFMPGGFVGVDIFFVLSGYLITGTLLRPMEAGRYSLRDFYRRRIRRLFPVLFTVLTVTLILGLIIFPPQILMAQLEQHFFAVLFVSNLYFEGKTSYFDLNASLLPLLHTWSLGVEEQFYLLFPLILFACFKYARRYIWLLIFILALLSLAYSQHSVSANPKAAFYNPLSRTFELMIGALCVGVERKIRLRPIGFQILSSLGFFAILFSLFWVNSTSAFPGVLALIPTLGTAAIILSKDAIGNRLISAKPFVWVGDISYSLYLWHWPLLVFAVFLYPSNMWGVAGAVVLSFFLSGLSYKYIERPFIRKTPNYIFWKAGGLIIGSILVCLALYAAKGVPSRFSPEARVFLEASNDYNKELSKCHMRSGQPMPYDQMCVYGAAETPASWVVLGDSHGTELAMVLGQKLGERGASLKSITMSGCAAVESRGGVCGAHISSTLAAIQSDPNIQTVVLSSNISNTDPRAPATIEGIQKSAQALTSAGKRVIIVYPLPTFDFDPPSMLAMTVRRGGDVSTVGMKRGVHNARKANLNAALDEIIQDPNIYGINSTELYCSETLCPVWQEDIGTLYYNSNHISLTGAELLADKIITRFVLK